LETVPVHIRHIALLAAATLGSATLAAPLAAQYVPRSPEPAYQFFVGFSPLVIPFNIGEVEAETAIAPGVTLGASGSYTEINDDRWSTGEAKIRFYPSNIAFRGLAFGVGVGLTRFSNLMTSCCDANPQSSWASLDAPTMGMLVDYDWTPSTRNHQFVIGLGAEAKRIVASDQNRNALGLPTAYLSGRFVLGYAF
jgi:hypothetical protein